MVSIRKDAENVGSGKVKLKICYAVLAITTRKEDEKYSREVLFLQYQAMKMVNMQENFYFCSFAA